MGGPQIITAIKHSVASSWFSSLRLQRQVFVRPILLPAASLARLTAGSSIGLTLYVQFWAPDDGRKTRLKHAERLTEINKLWNVASCWLCSVNILAMHGYMNAEDSSFFSKNALAVSVLPGKGSKDVFSSRATCCPRAAGWAGPC